MVANAFQEANDLVALKARTSDVVEEV